MYDKAKGILPPGQYLVGRDIPVGGYILSTIDDSQNSTYVLYKSYKDFMNEENEISYKYFNGDFHISLMAEGTFLEVVIAISDKVLEIRPAIVRWSFYIKSFDFVRHSS